MLQEGPRPVKPRVRMATIDLVNRIRKLVPKYTCWEDGYMGVICCKDTFPITVKCHQDHYRLIDDTEIAFSKYGRLEKIP